MRDITPRTSWTERAAFYAAERYHLDPLVGRPETFLFFEEVRRLLDSYDPERVGIGEIVSEKGLYHYLEFSLPGRLHFAFNYDFIETLSRDPKRIHDLVSRTEQMYDGRAWPCYVLGNLGYERCIT
ncbi:MAG TPA: hypothetical protein VLH40_06720 [Atribacteraceae bacterium]|nr:hypothetical protein [Atribacteraceae bacterium]